MSFLQCQKCGQEISSKIDFENHIKIDHGMKIQKYCENFLKKTDLITGEPIIFKSFDQYILTDFLNKKDMLKWLKINKESGLSEKFISNKIIEHSKIKSVGFFPSSSEMRTISYLPSMKTYRFFFEDLNGFIDSTGLIRRYNYNLNELKLNFICEKNITIDTREQKPLVFKDLSAKIEKLDYGDYSCDGLLAVERKSLNDLVSTLSSGFERFCREIERCRKNNGYLVVVAECDINKFLSFSYSRVGRFAKAGSDFIFHRLREICRNYPETVQFCFSGGRKESSNLIKLILSNSLDVIKNIDLQNCIEEGHIDICGK